MRECDLRSCRRSLDHDLVDHHVGGDLVGVERLLVALAAGGRDPRITAAFVRVDAVAESLFVATREGFVVVDDRFADFAFFAFQAAQAMRIRSAARADQREAGQDRDAHHPTVPRQRASDKVGTRGLCTFAA